MKLYRFRKNYARLYSETSDFLKNSLLRLTNFGELNDVFEGRPAPYIIPADDDFERTRNVAIGLTQFAIDQQLDPDPIKIINAILAEEREVYDKHANNPLELVDLIRSRIRSVSFTSNLDSDLIWAHYSNGHKGWCFEYETNPTLSRFSRDTLHEVKYSKERPKLRLSDCFSLQIFLRVLQAASEANRPLMQSEFSALMMGQFLEGKGFYDVIKSITIFKSDSWSYEAEYRIVDYLSQSGLLEVKSLTLRGIVFGYMADDYEIQNFKNRFGGDLVIKKMALCDENYAFKPMVV